MPRGKARPVFELGGQWIAAEPGRRSLYRFWNDAGTGRTRRESLGTTDLEAAKRKLAEIVVRGAPKTASAFLSAVFLDYFQARTDKLPSKKQSRNAGRILLKCWGDSVRVSAINEAKQKAFAEWSLDQGFSLSYVARNLTVLKAALSHANISAPAKIICAESKMRERWGLMPTAARDIFIPSDEDLIRLFKAEMPTMLRRWLLISLLTGCRPQAAIDLAPSARRRDAGTINLNPAGRAQNKKHRPVVRVPRALRALLNKWEREGLNPFGGRYCGYTTIEGVKSALERVRAKKDVSLPTFSTYSCRHKVTTVLRGARVDEDQIAMQLGHRRANMRVTGGYGEWSPDYLSGAAAALDRWLLGLHRRAKSHGNPTTIRERNRKAA